MALSTSTFLQEKSDPLDQITGLYSDLLSLVRLVAEVWILDEAKIEKESHLVAIEKVVVLEVAILDFVEIDIELIRNLNSHW